MEQTILCLNAGSSSLKFAVYRLRDSDEKRILSGAAEAIGVVGGRFWLKGNDGRTINDCSQEFPDHRKAVEAMFAALEEQGIRNLDAAGHRMVHGGALFFDPQRVDSQLTVRLKELVPLAPLHLPSQIAIVEELSWGRPDLAQVVCFDTAFHRRIPEIARRFALPRNLWDQGVLRYGFHGLSYEFVTGKLGQNLGARTIIAHLGNGASMVALRDGIPVDTSMGLTPTGGFMMGTRSGDLDPGVLLYLLRQGWTAERLAMMLDHQSGLTGVSALTSDMKTLLEKRGSEPQAAQAVEMFCYQVRKFIGAFAAVLNGLDTLVFTGGIGERAAVVRSEICRGLGFIGVDLEEDNNAGDAAVISSPKSVCVVRVVETDEDLMIARHTRQVAQRPQ
jgi:acetate kinase